MEMTQERAYTAGACSRRNESSGSAIGRESEQVVAGRLLVTPAVKKFTNVMDIEIPAAFSQKSVFVSG
jgi:hypothetical protein